MSDLAPVTGEEANQPPRFRKDINGLRALSVGLVVLFHVGWKGAGGGFLGVDVFFVISGFLMTQIIDRRLRAGRFSYWRFLAERAARIWPALGAMLLVWLVGGVAFLPPSDLRELARQALGAASFWSNHYFLDRSGYDTGGADGNWLLHTWTLSVEWQFYVLYPLLLLAVARLAQRGHRRNLGPWVVAALALLSLARHVLLSRSHPSEAFFLLTARAWEMAVGGLVHWLGPRTALGSSPRRSAASTAGLLLIVGSALWFGLAHIAPVGLGWRSVVPVAGAAIVLWSAHGESFLFRPSWIQRLGSASYSIYLWHWPLVVASRLGDLPRLHPLATQVGLIVASIALGLLSFTYVESLSRHARGDVRWAALAKPLALLVLASLAALVVTATSGLAFRMPRGTPLVVPTREADYFPASCSNFMVTAAELRTCTIAKDDRRHVLVIGDSHAEHLYPWFARKSQVSVDFFTEAECPPVPNFDRLQEGFHCLDYATRAWRTAASPRYDTIIISGTWNLVGGNGPRYCHRDATGTCSPIVDRDQRRALIVAELRTAMESLLAAGKIVVVLDGTPESLVKVPQRLERERFWFGGVRLSIDRASLREYDWIDALFSDLTNRAGFHRVSLRPKLCDAATCRVYDDVLQRPIYVDQSHFDPQWIAQNGDVFAPFVRLSRAP
jgi:peptidoglycan/LPS O-acetylase OafA/YrhL